MGIIYIMVQTFTQPVVSPHETPIDARNSINAQASALAKLGGRRRRSKKRTSKSKRNKRNKSKRSKRRRNRLQGGGVIAPYVKSSGGEQSSGSTINKIAAAQMAGAENAKYDSK